MRYKQLADMCIKNIETGKRLHLSRMPSLRNFAQQHSVSMTTALNCYQHLESLGWIVAKPQSGYFVSQAFHQYEKPEFINFESKTTDPKLGASNGSYTSSYKVIGPLGVARMSPDLMPLEQLHQSFRRAMKRQGLNISDYPDTQGEKVLRDSLSGHFKHYDFHVSAQELVISNGGMDAIQTALEITTNVGDAVAISSPCFSGLLDMLTQLSRKVIEIPSTDEGIDLVQLEKQMKNGDVKAGLFCTSHMNPQGISMSALQKMQLAKLAEKYQIPIIEDDVYLELGHSKVTPLPAKHWDNNGYVLWCGSVSKTLAAGYRLGWCLPGRYFKQYLQRRMFCNQGVSSLTQLAVADLINNGDYLKHLKKLRFHLQQQTLDYQRYLSQHLPRTSKMSAPSGGFVLWVQVPNLNTSALLSQAIKCDIDIRIGESFSTLGLYKDCFRLNVGFALSKDANQEDTVDNQMAQLINLIRKNC
ncbi:MAG: DNA-binding transcriptional MocR family regulator [Moritella sp.]|jgi:DNA-binding transcriptional MocR family regulator